MPRALVASVSTPTRLPKNRRSIAGISVAGKIIKPKSVDALSESGWLGSPANVVNRLEKEGSEKDLEMGMNEVKFGRPSRKKRTKQDCSSIEEVAGMDMSGAKFGPPSRKKRKEQDGTSRTDSGPISSTCDRNSIVSPTVTFNNPYNMCGR